MTVRNGNLLLIAAVLVACGRAPMSAEAGGAESYSIAREAQEGSLLKLDWNGEGRDLASGQVIAVPDADARRMTFVSINFMYRAPLPWRSTLDRKLKLGELSSRQVLTEPIERAKLVRAYLPNDEFSGDFFFNQDVGSDLNGDMYVAQCSTPFPWEKGAIHCTTQLGVESFAVEIRFDKAFLWDFDNLQARAVAAAKAYIARPSTQQSIKSIPKLDLPSTPSPGSGG
jgi:hypothetical protein